MKCYLMLDDEPLDRRSLVIVKTEEEALKLIRYVSWWESYEEVDMMEAKDVDIMISDNIVGRLDDDTYEQYCSDCNNLKCYECNIAKTVLGDEL